MEELLELRTGIEQQRYQETLLLIGEREEMSEVIAEEYPLALKAAALEIFEGQYTDEQLNKQVSPAGIEQLALKMIEV